MSEMATTYAAFLSHDWGTDELGRRTHDRVKRVHALLRQNGIATWLDEEEMRGNIVQRMTEGIESSTLVLVFVTRNYIDKAAGRGPNGESDNVFREFQYSCQRKTVGVQLLPVVLEPSCLNQRTWDGAVGFNLGNHLYVDLADDSDFESKVTSDLAPRIRAALAMPSSSAHPANAPAPAAAGSGAGSSRAVAETLSWGAGFAAFVSRVAPYVQTRQYRAAIADGARQAMQNLLQLWHRNEPRRITIRFEASADWIRAKRRRQNELELRLREMLRFRDPPDKIEIDEFNVARVSRPHAWVEIDVGVQTSEAGVRERVKSLFCLREGELEVCDLRKGSVICELQAPEWALVRLLGAIAAGDAELMQLCGALELTPMDASFDWPREEREAERETDMPPGEGIPGGDDKQKAGGKRPFVGSSSTDAAEASAPKAPRGNEEFTQRLSIPKDPEPGLLEPLGTRKKVKEPEHSGTMLSQPQPSERKQKDTPLTPIDEWTPTHSHEQWRQLLARPHRSEAEWARVIGNFRGPQRRMIVISTRFDGPSYMAAKKVTSLVEMGTVEFGMAVSSPTPCFNPNIWPCVHDWLQVWECFAASAKESGGHVIQLMDPSLGLSPMQEKEARVASRLAISVQVVTLPQVERHAVYMSSSTGYRSLGTSSASASVDHTINADSTAGPDSVRKSYRKR